MTTNRLANWAMSVPSIAARLRAPGTFGFSGIVQDAQKTNPTLAGWTLILADQEREPTGDELQAIRAIGDYAAVRYVTPKGIDDITPVDQAGFDLVTKGVYAIATDGGAGAGALGGVSPWIIGLAAVTAFWLLVGRRR